MWIYYNKHNKKKNTIKINSWDGFWLYEIRKRCTIIIHQDISKYIKKKIYWLNEYISIYKDEKKMFLIENKIQNHRFIEI